MMTEEEDGPAFVLPCCAVVEFTFFERFSNQATRSCVSGRFGPSSKEESGAIFRNFSLKVATLARFTKSTSPILPVKFSARWAHRVTFTSALLASAKKTSSFLTVRAPNLVCLSSRELFLTHTPITSANKKSSSKRRAIFAQHD